MAGDEGPSSSSLFPQLKDYCLDLLQLLRTPRKSSPALLELADLLRRSPADALQPCLEFTMLPLMLLLDAAVLCRSQNKGDIKKEQLRVGSTKSTPLLISDAVAEAVLLCLEEILKKCHLESLNQILVMLKKLASGAMLSPSEASEEFREGIVRCFRAMLVMIHPCSNEICLCKRISSLPVFLLGEQLHTLLMDPSCHSPKSDECLLAFLQSQDASPAIGHWLSLLLQIANTEADRGLHGSSKLRAESFITLRVLVAKVGTADALAFFLPGVVSQFTKVLHVSRNMISGAAGSMESLDNVIRGLAEFLIIVLGDEANADSLDISINLNSASYFDKEISSHFILETLRNLPADLDSKGRLQQSSSITSDISAEGKRFTFGHAERSLHVERTKKWLEETSTHVDKLLSASFPHICRHPAKKVRKGLVDAIQGLVMRCTETLKRSKLLLLECLCVLSCDDFIDVSTAAHDVLEHVFMSEGRYISETELLNLFSSLVEKLPRLVLGSDETIALSHAQKLLVVMYYAGPQFLLRHLLSPPVEAARFLNVLTLSLSHNSVFAGSIGTLVAARQNPISYLSSVSELKAESCLSSDDQINVTTDSAVFPYSFDSHHVRTSLESLPNNYDLPRMPPWFVHVGCQKLYKVLAGILRLVGLSTMADRRNDISLQILTDILLDSVRKLVLELRMREYSKESWSTWYVRNGSGQLIREASTSMCVLMEVMFGLTHKSLYSFANIFQESQTKARYNDKQASNVPNEPIWKVLPERVMSNHIIDCVGSILHEYVSSEIWKLPIDQSSMELTQDAEKLSMSLHFFQDTATLHQVAIDGIGVFSITLGKEFLGGGFLHATLYLLLENLICSNNQVRTAADGVLHVLASSTGHPNVRQLVVANSDYIIDSLCRQLRHLDLNPQMPDVLSAILSYIGIAHDILPLLEEPMRSVSMELEILGRRQHPQLTIPFMKAMVEICKASRNEVSELLNEAKSFSKHVKSIASELEKREGRMTPCSEPTISSDDLELQVEELDEMLLKLAESRRHRRIVASVTGSCLTAAIPLVASRNEGMCLVALGIVEDGIFTLEKVEAAYSHEIESREAIRHAIQLCSLHELEDDTDATDDGVDENILLPAMNKIWPCLVQCLSSNNFLAIRRCLAVVSNVINVCGGTFFTRRFHTDGPHFWKLLSTSPFRRNIRSKEEKKPILLPYRGTSESSEESMAEVSSVKVQLAALNMIAEISRNKRSSSAFEAVIKKISGLVLGIACSGISSLREAAINALLALACMDPDLIWLLVADVYYSSKKEQLLPPSPDFPDVFQILPPPLSSKDYLYVQYGGESLGFDVNLLSVEIIFQRLCSADILS